MMLKAATPRKTSQCPAEVARDVNPDTAAFSCKCQAKVFTPKLNRLLQDNYKVEFTAPHTTTVALPQAFLTTFWSFVNCGVPSPVTASQPSVHFQPDLAFPPMALLPFVMSVKASPC